MGAAARIVVLAGELLSPSFTNAMVLLQTIRAVAKGNTTIEYDT